MENIELFNLAAAEIFGKCYKLFPLPISISIIEIGDSIKKLQGADIDLRDKEFEIASASLSWLSEAGYIWHKNASNVEFYGVILTPKGLEVMNAIPSELKLKMSLGEQLQNGIKEIGKDTAITAVKSGLSYGVNLIIGS